MIINNENSNNKYDLHQNTGIRITFVIVDRNSIKVAVEINEMCVNTNKCNNVVPATRTRKLLIWELVLKSAMISTQKSTVKDETIFTDAIIKQTVQQYSPLYSLNAFFFNCCKIKEYKRCGYVVVYWSKIRHMYCFNEDNIRCDGTTVLYLLPLCSLIWKMNNQ